MLLGPQCPRVLAGSVWRWHLNELPGERNLNLISGNVLPAYGNYFKIFSVGYLIDLTNVTSVLICF